MLADERSRTVKAELSRDHELIYPPIQEFWDAAVKGSRIGRAPVISPWGGRDASYRCDPASAEGPGVAG